MPNEEIYQKFDNLKKYLHELGSMAVAFSGGVDSAFLLETAHEALGNKIAAITAASRLFPARELNEAKAFCAERGIRHIICQIDELAIEGFRDNPADRCYICKKAIFQKLKSVAAENNLQYIAEGSNMDDNGDYRPGLRAIAELDIKSPLRHAKLWKKEIRRLSKESGLPTWKKPSFACLASRFPYGETISEEKLSMVEKAEQFMLDHGFIQVRVRIHKDVARIEILPEEFAKVLARDFRDKLVAAFKSYGFAYVSLDLQGYRSGSMNETLL